MSADSRRHPAVDVLNSSLGNDSSGSLFDTSQGAGQSRQSLVQAMPDFDSEASSTCLRHVVSRAVAQYLKDMGNTPPDNLHERIVREVEVPLIQTVLEHTGRNQSRAAEILGMTRSTLRNRIRRYDL